MSAKDLNLNEIHSLDRQIEILKECKPLTETEVKQLCEKVCSIISLVNKKTNMIYRQRRF